MISSMLANQSGNISQQRLRHPLCWATLGHRWTVGMVCIAFFFASTVTNVFGQNGSQTRPNLPQMATNIVYVNDLKSIKHTSHADESLQATESLMAVSGRDPHIIFTLDKNWLSSAAESPQATYPLTLPFKLKSQPKGPEQSKNDNAALSHIKLELFYKVAAQTNQQYVTNPWFRLVYSLPMAALANADLEGTGLTVSIPKFVELNPNTLLRLDLDGCESCTITVLERPFANASEELIAQRIMNGTVNLEADDLSIEPEEWTLRNLVRSDRGLIPQTSDAYMVTPHLDLTAQSVAGLGLTLSAYRTNPDGVLSSHARSQQGTQASELIEFQIFHSDNLHGFHDRASSQFKLWLNPSVGLSQNSNSPNQAPSCDYRVFIPLTHIVKEMPEAADPLVLDQLRVDFPSDTSLRWTICDTWLVPLANLSAEVEHQPALLHHQRLDRASGLTLLKGTLTNLLRDWPFVLALLVLLLLTVWRTLLAVKR